MLGGLAGGVALLIAFCVIETKIAEPMFRMGLFRIRAFAAGNVASLLGSIARGGLQFMLVIWLAGIWLPLHGYDFADTPLWAGHLHAAADRRLPDRRARSRGTCPTGTARARSPPPACWSRPARSSA